MTVVRHPFQTLGSWQGKRDALKTATGPNLPSALALLFRAALEAAQDGRCYLCGGAFAARNAWVGRYRSYMADPARRSFDHVTPRALGGADDWRNLLFAHASCNAEKGDRPPTPCELFYLEWIKFLFPTRTLQALALHDQRMAA